MKYIHFFSRQITDLDAVCLKHCGPKDEMTGSRVFGDCDVFMKEIMKNILDPKDLKSWESGREKRMKSYNSCRVLVV